jgi:hypothetical protein
VKFKYDKPSGDWLSDCGKYRVWLQGRLLHGEREWAAQFEDDLPWLCSMAVDKREAIDYCKDHKAKHE